MATKIRVRNLRFHNESEVRIYRATKDSVIGANPAEWRAPGTDINFSAEIKLQQAYKIPAVAPSPFAGLIEFNLDTDEGRLVELETVQSFESLSGLFTQLGVLGIKATPLNEWTPLSGV